MKEYKHLNLEDRIRIQVGIAGGTSLNAIAKAIGRSRSTVVREIKINRTSIYIGTYGKGANNCIHRKSCTITGVCDYCYYRSGRCSYCGKCTELCQSYKAEVCPATVSAPFCCNSCKRQNNCTLSRYRYDASVANKTAQKRLSSQRSGTTLTEAEIDFLDDLVSPLLLKGQSLHHIYTNHADRMPCSERTLYTMVDSGMLRARNIDMPRKMRRILPRQRKEHKVDQACRIGRSYEDFLNYLEQYPDLIATQMDTVLGCKGSCKVLLTLYWPQAQFLLMRLRERNNARSVYDCFNGLEMTLGTKTFSRLFPLCVTDNGSEFSDPAALEHHGRTRIFYCDPLNSNQKASLERAHQFIRAIRPKGTSFDDLRQADIDLMASHINSYSRPNLGDKTPYDVFELIFGAQSLEQLGIRRIKPDDVCLKPNLLPCRKLVCV